MASVRTPNSVGSRTKTIRLDKIRLDGDTQSRLSLDENLIHEYAGLLTNGHEFPPLLVVFDGADYWLVDGFHRRWAAIKSKRDKFKCVVVEGTREDARWLSYGVNKDHGMPRTNEDKKKAVVAALKHPKGAKQSDGQLAEHVGVSQPMVTKYRQQLIATQKDFESPDRTGRDGRTINTANIGRKPLPVETRTDRPAIQNRPPVASERTEVKEPTPFDRLCEWWGKADKAARIRFRLWIDEQGK